MLPTVVSIKKGWFRDGHRDLNLLPGNTCRHQVCPDMPLYERCFHHLNIVKYEVPQLMDFPFILFFLTFPMADFQSGEHLDTRTESTPTEASCSLLQATWSHSVSFQKGLELQSSTGSTGKHVTDLQPHTECRMSLWNAVTQQLFELVFVLRG